LAFFPFFRTHPQLTHGAGGDNNNNNNNDEYARYVSVYPDTVPAELEPILGGLVHKALGSRPPVTLEFESCRVCSMSMIREELGRMEAVQVARIARADRIQRYRVVVANTAFAASRKAAADACADLIKLLAADAKPSRRARARQLEGEIEVIALLTSKRAASETAVAAKRARMLRPLVRTRPRHQRAAMRAARVPAGRAQVLPAVAIFFFLEKIYIKNLKKHFICHNSVS
jgi:hypothetical protein